MTKRERNQQDKRIEAAYRAACCGIQIDVMDIGRVFVVGRGACDAGKTDEQLREVLRAFVETIRCDKVRA